MFEQLRTIHKYFISGRRHRRAVDTSVCFREGLLSKHVILEYEKGCHQAEDCLMHSMKPFSFINKILLYLQQGVFSLIVYLQLHRVLNPNFFVILCKQQSGMHKEGIMANLPIAYPAFNDN